MPDSQDSKCEKSSVLPHHQKTVFKIIVVGDSSVGKTCLTFRFCEGRFPLKTEATIGVDFREKALEIDGESIKVYLVIHIESVYQTKLFLKASIVGHCWSRTIQEINDSSLLQKC